MKRVAIEGVADPVDVRTNQRLLDALTESGTPLLLACGGKGLCATCHVYVTNGAERLSPRTPREQMSLRMLSDLRPNSRLACQAKVQGEGVTVTLPRGRYLTASKDLGALIGRRAEERILHPLDGRVLIETGKIRGRGRRGVHRGADHGSAASRRSGRAGGRLAPGGAGQSPRARRPGPDLR